MKKFLLFLLVLIIALAAATQFLLPSYISSRIEKQLNDSLKPSAQSVNVESQPGFKLLYGDLAAFLSTQAGSEIKDVNVTIDKDNISLTGQMNVGMVFKGAVKLDGNLELNNNKLLFSPKKFTINGATIPGLTSNVLEDTEIYDFNNFPIPVKADTLTTDNGQIRIKVKPILN